MPVAGHCVISGAVLHDAWVLFLRVVNDANARLSKNHGALAFVMCSGAVLCRRMPLFRAEMMPVAGHCVINGAVLHDAWVLCLRLVNDATAPLSKDSRGLDVCYLLGRCFVSKDASV